MLHQLQKHDVHDKHGRKTGVASATSLPEPLQTKEGSSQRRIQQEPEAEKLQHRHPALGHVPQYPSQQKAPRKKRFKENQFGKLLTQARSWKMESQWSDFLSFADRIRWIRELTGTSERKPKTSCNGQQMAVRWRYKKDDYYVRAARLPREDTGHRAPPR